MASRPIAWGGRRPVSALCHRGGHNALHGLLRNALCHGGGSAHNALCHGAALCATRCVMGAGLCATRCVTGTGLCATRCVSGAGLCVTLCVTLCHGGPVLNALCYREAGRAQRVCNALCHRAPSKNQRRVVRELPTWALAFVPTPSTSVIVAPPIFE